MRILQLTSARHLGGGERHLIDLTNALVQRGHDVFVAVIPKSPLLPELSHVPNANILSLPLRNALDLASAWTLKKFVRARQIEIVHAHVARDYPLAALAVGRSGPAKLVLSRHVMFPMSSIHRLTRRRVSRVIAVSQAVAANLRAQNIFDERQITLVRHGIDLERFLLGENHQTQRKDGRLRVGMLGELSPVKGQADFVRAAAVIAAERDDVEFVILGRDNSGSGENRRQIEELIEAVGLASRMKLVESIDDTAVFLRDLDVFVSASRSEAFGLAIVEAMACGTPVVATRSEGACEIIEDNRTGRLVEIGAVPEMAQAVSELLSDDQKRRVLSANASTVVAERFSLKRMVDETEAVYREVLNQA